VTGIRHSAFSLLTGAFGTTSRLLSGKGGRRRWRELAVLAAMAGIVGAGAAPPPLGLLQPVWEAPEVRQVLAENGWILVTVTALALFLVFMGAVARSFTFAFLQGIRTGDPRAAEFRRHLNPGAAHFAWSSALTVPLYLVLWGGEAWVTHGVYTRFLDLLAQPDTPPAELMGLLGAGTGQFLLVLLPWTLLTLPAMVVMYELTPAAMLVEGVGPGKGFGRVVRAAGRCPGLFAGYLGVRLLLQLMGSVAAFIALIPCLFLSAVLSAPLLGVGWLLFNTLGGPASPGAICAATVTTLLSAVIFYCVLCAALIPVSVLLNAYAVHFVERMKAEG
jgi:hypothetical protein